VALLHDLARHDGPGSRGQTADFVARIVAEPGAVGEGDTDEDGFFETNRQIVPFMIE
jgi:hypothetical protein